MYSKRQVDFRLDRESLPKVSSLVMSPRPRAYLLTEGEPLRLWGLERVARVDQRTNRDANLAQKDVSAHSVTVPDTGPQNASHEVVVTYGILKEKRQEALYGSVVVADKRDQTILKLLYQLCVDEGKFDRTVNSWTLFYHKSVTHSSPSLLLR